MMCVCLRAERRQRTPAETNGFWISFTFKSFVRYEMSWELTQQQPRCRSRPDEETGGSALALELPNGQIVTGKNSELFGPTAAALINAIKTSAGIDKDTKLIEPEVVKPIQGLKIDHLGSRNPRLHSNEILIALAITAANNADAARAMEELGNLKGSEAHSTIILTDEDKNVLRKLGINVTFDPYYQYDKLYRK